MVMYGRGQESHPACSPDPSAAAAVERWLGPTVVAPAPAAVLQNGQRHQEEHGQEHDEHQDEEHAHPEARKFDGYAELVRSVDLSRFKPIPRVAKVERDSAPWSLMDEDLDGAHQSGGWTGPMPDDGLVGILDRNGSFPSACSSVPLAPNKLTHTGALGADPYERKTRAGIFQIVIPPWAEEDRTPHPFGRLGRVGELRWIGSPHMELCDKLARTGRMPVVDVLDSWTGVRNTSLFERFYQWCKLIRQQTAGQDKETRDEAKRAISTAIRAVWPKDAPSPFWRPDWNLAIRAEASVRHWITADAAVSRGAVLLSLGNTDEAVFVVPPDTPDPNLWVPEPYRRGGGFGEVKHKDMTVRTLDADQQAVRLMSPVTVAQYLDRGRPGRGNRKR
jgi:hypothetical protein